MNNILQSMKQDAATQGHYVEITQRGLCRQYHDSFGEKLMGIQYLIYVDRNKVYESNANFSMEYKKHGENVVEKCIQQLMERVLIHMIRTGVTSMCKSSVIRPETEL